MVECAWTNTLYGGDNSKVLREPSLKIQVLTIRELLDGSKAKFPAMGAVAAIKDAPKRKYGEQRSLFRRSSVLTAVSCAARLPSSCHSGG